MIFSLSLKMSLIILREILKPLSSHHQQQNPCKKVKLSSFRTDVSGFRNSTLSRSRRREELGKDLSQHLVPGTSELYTTLEKKKSKIFSFWKYYFLAYFTIYLNSDIIGLSIKTKHPTVGWLWLKITMYRNHIKKTGVPSL